MGAPQGRPQPRTISSFGPRRCGRPARGERCSGPDDGARADRDRRQTEGKRGSMASLTMKELLEAGVHFGHQTKRWNPKMQKYIFGERNGIYIIDLQKTLKKFREAYAFIRELAPGWRTPAWRAGARSPRKSPRKLPPRR